MAILRAGGPNLISDAASANSPRADATEQDLVNGELPDRNSDFNELLAFYTRKGLSRSDLVSSSAVGHSLGGIGRGGNGVAPFTPDRLTISSNYAVNLVQRLENGGGNLPGFNTLNSDETLSSDATMLERLRFYTGCTQAVEGCTQDAALGLRIMNGDFRVFFVKMGRLTGTTVGNSAVLSAGF